MASHLYNGPLPVGLNLGRGSLLLVRLLFKLPQCPDHDGSCGGGVGVYTSDQGAVKCITLHSWLVNPKLFCVAHSCMPVTSCCKYFYVVLRECPQKQITRSSTSGALNMAMAKLWGLLSSFNPKHVTAMTPQVGTPSG